MIHSDIMLIKNILNSNQFIQTDGSDWSISWAGKNFPPKAIDEMKEDQKINHFPFSTCITMKDELARNLKKMQNKYGEHVYDFFPETFILPNDINDLFNSYSKTKKNKEKAVWIVKPNALSQGKGIYLVYDLSDRKAIRIAMHRKLHSKQVY